MSKRRIGSLVATVLLFAAIILAALNVQRIQDLVLYSQYEPSATVASFATDSGMSERGKFLFYASQPLVLEAEDFNQQCEKKEKTTAILGCYDGYRIYVYNVTNPQLAGIRPTTAAHEMLHAAYGRLSSKDRLHVNALLEAEYDKLKDDVELSERMAFYARTQPGERENELHSIIGTEIIDISSELEAHYSRYFSDRSKVISQHKQYHTIFEGLQERSRILSEQIDALGSDISSKKSAYETEHVVVEGMISDFNRRADQGEFESQAVFARERRVLLGKTSALDALRTEINTRINEYNTLVEELNSIAVETDTLNRSMDSQLAPAPSLQG